MILFGISFTLAYTMNIYAVFSYGGSWSELFTQLHIVLLLALFLYILTMPPRLLCLGCRLLRKKWK